MVFCLTPCLLWQHVSSDCLFLAAGAVILGMPKQATGKSGQWVQIHVRHVLESVYLRRTELGPGQHTAFPWMPNEAKTKIQVKKNVQNDHSFNDFMVNIIQRNNKKFDFKWFRINSQHLKVSWSSAPPALTVAFQLKPMESHWLNTSES